MHRDSLWTGSEKERVKATNYSRDVNVCSCPAGKTTVYIKLPFNSLPKSHVSPFYPIALNTPNTTTKHPS